MLTDWLVTTWRSRLVVRQVKVLTTPHTGSPATFIVRELRLSEYFTFQALHSLSEPRPLTRKNKTYLYTELNKIWPCQDLNSDPAPCQSQKKKLGSVSRFKPRAKRLNQHDGLGRESNQGTWWGFEPRVKWLYQHNGLDPNSNPWLKDLMGFRTQGPKTWWGIKLRTKRLNQHDWLGRDSNPGPKDLMGIRTQDPRLGGNSNPGLNQCPWGVFWLWKSNLWFSLTKLSPGPKTWWGFKPRA